MTTTAATTTKSDFSRLLALFWDDNDSLRWKVDPDGVRFRAVWLTDEDEEFTAPINPGDLPDLQARYDAELAAGSRHPWEFIEEYVDAHQGAATEDGYGTEPFTVDEFTRRVLAVFENPNAGLSWYHDGTQLVATCSDFFFWGSADAEDITPDDIAVLDAAYLDAEAAGHPDWAGHLFAARKRRLRPQGAFYEMIPPALVAMFDACGPEREAGLGNPCTREQGLDRALKAS